MRGRGTLPYLAPSGGVNPSAVHPGAARSRRDPRNSWYHHQSGPSVSLTSRLAGNRLPVRVQWVVG